MYLKRFFVEGLAHASYLFGDGREAAVVDPKRDVDDYVAEAEREGLRIVAILNSHPHADFASGFNELAERTGARIYVSHRAPAKYERVSAKQGDEVRLGAVKVEVLETPGHSPDSLSFLVREHGQPTAVFTGDLLFVNDVGRPDLRDADEDPSGLAGKLYDSLFQQILTLPDEVKVYPSHGAGSLCGRAISDAPYSLVGQERRVNWALQLKDREEFIRQMTANLPDRPAYFSYDVELNLKGVQALASLDPLSALDADEMRSAASAGATIVDTRTADQFGAGHYPGSINIGVASASFPTWAGFFVNPATPIVLVVASREEASQARLGLARIGFDAVHGYFDAARLTEKRALAQLNVKELREQLCRADSPLVLDVRGPGEWRNGHLEQATHVPLPTFAAQVPDLPKDRAVAVICGSGYRSSIATSLLERHGYTRLQNVSGGMEAVNQAEP